VLSGAEQPRQWQQPIALLDVVRAAAAEIADFPRVELVGIEGDVAVAGRAVADVAHLVAELLENATSFSPPDSAVVVSGAVTATGFVLAVSDQGIGMPVERIAEANQLLAKPPLVGLALSRALGLHVVASLAARHHITVELRPGAPLGLVALVSLPTSVLEERPAPAPPEPVYAPEVDEDGAPAPLGARRVVWRPADEPPVEEWRREGMGDAESVPPIADAPAPAADTFAAPPPPEFTPPQFAAPPFAPPPFDPAADTADGAFSTPPPNEQVPLPTRVPGQHLSHQPNADATDDGAEADPLRPYRVHELLTRHAQGKRRGRAEHDGDAHSSETTDSDITDAGLGGPPMDGPLREDRR
jgi:hypothetical protein